MKKVLFIFFLLIFIGITNSNQKIESVFLESNNRKGRYYLDFSDINLNTSNIKEKFNSYDIDVVALYPYISSIYHSILNKDLDYFYINNINNLSDFTIYYKNILKKLGKNNSLGYASFNIRIDKVIVYSSFYELERFLSSNEFVKII